MEYVLETKALCKQYGHFGKALDNLEMHVPKGAIYGFVGKNGAGKTTLIRVITGLQEPTSGSYAIYGVRNGSRKMPGVRRRMGAVVETPSIYMSMTAEENLKTQFMILGMPSFDGLHNLLRLVGLDNTGEKKARDFSLGMRQRLGIAIALAGSSLVNMLQASPTTQTYIQQGTMWVASGEEIPNPNYVSGATRVFCELLCHINPAAVGIEMATVDIVNPLAEIAYSAAETVMLLVAGCAVFKRKDLK